ncbi:hypothetical protein EUGRSUZ_H00551 [Eucalyptus grandis]|uniref:Uncharacterized protein n=2 Tax=Eucalyptus grandis TaxID=71139 RepID=A0ACC3JL28_EUCGR|nr:hypothetical protein EUGRSUZ_H00551 [Eucalyptus grandis]
MEPSRRVAGRESRGQAAEEMAVHSRVRKIKRESDRVVDWWPDPLETRPHLREIAPSPLGLSGAAIAVGDS